jgi:hypothetical protein
MKKNFLQYTLLLCTVLISLLACQKDINPGGGGGVDNPVDLGSRVNASVSGFVTDENEQPVINAMVRFGTLTVPTDDYGYFQISNVSVPKNAAMVTVNQGGYFPGIRTFIAKEGKATFVRIKLMPKTVSGTISAANGGNVTLSNGLKVAIPSSAVVDATTGAAYTGTINVAAKWIDPTAADLSRIMPGDLRAIDADDNFKQLMTYGMAAVELTSTSGDKLQIAPGKKATLTWPLPAALAGTAPATIPLWHFDEAIGLWREEGSATKTGNSYEGEVSHFSFWNCDVPNNYVQLDLTVKNPDNTPVRYAYVLVTNLSNNQQASGYTDSTGYVIGAVPPNANLRVDVFYGNSCGTPLHTQNVTTTNTNLSLGTVTIVNNTSMASLTGNVVDCNGQPVTNGTLYINTNGWYYRHNLSNTGSFNIPFYLCNGNSIAASVIAEDYGTTQQSAEINHTIVTGLNNLGTIAACGTTSNQFMNITVNGSPEGFTHPADSLTYFFNNQSGSTISAAKQSGGAITSVTIGFEHTGITVGGSYPVTFFNSTLLGAPNSTSVTVNAGSTVSVTEFGAIGGFIAGTYSINATGPAPTNTPYTVTGSFRMRRNN